MIRLTLRVWATSPAVLAAGGLAALVVAAALLGTWVSIRTGIPAVNVAVTMLLVLALGGSCVTTLMLPRRRPVAVRAAAPVEPSAPGAWTPRPARGVAGRGVPRPAVAHLPPATAGPVVAGGAL